MMDRIEAVAEVMASMDGKLDYFRRERGMIMPPEDQWEALDWRGHYLGYMAEAPEIIARLETRGFTVSALASENQQPEGRDQTIVSP